MKTQDRIDQYIESLRNPNRKSSGKISPSSLGRCYRAAYLKRKGEAPSNPPTKEAKRKMYMGTLIHEACQQAQPNISHEVKIEEEDIKGFADSVVIEDNVVVDYKSQSSRAFWYMAKSDYNIKDKKYGDILQVMLYAWKLGQPKGRLVYISKDDWFIEEYEFGTDTWIPRIEAELAQIRAFWAKGILPPASPRAYPDKDGKPRECKYCDYRDKCKELDGTPCSK